jgi:GNAT superfamily N-acetyltransferase
MRNHSLDLVLRFDAERVYVDHQEPARYVIEHSGVLDLVDEDDEVVETIGSFSAIVVDAIAALVDKESPFDVFDSYSITFGFFENLYESNGGDFKEKVIKTVGEDNFLWNPNLLILNRLVVTPEHRGHGIGLLALRTLIQRFGIGVGVVAMKPFPLQFEAASLDDPKTCARLGFDQFNLTQSKATAKLRKYYGRLGFKKVPGSEMMIRGLDVPLPLLDAYSDAT